MKESFKYKGRSRGWSPKFATGLNVMIGIDKKDMSECVVSEGDVQKYVGYLAMKVDELDRPGRILHGVDRLDFFP